MDNNQLTTAGLTATFTAIVGITYKIFRAVNGKKIHSRCCDRDIEMGMQVEDMTPPTQHPVINIPPESFINNPLNK
jgi:hypothetical protein